MTSLIIEWWCSSCLVFTTKHTIRSSDIFRKHDKPQTFTHIKYEVRKINKVDIIIIYLYGSADRGASVSEYLFYVFHVHNEHDDECNEKTIWMTD